MVLWSDLHCTVTVSEILIFMENDRSFLYDEAVICIWLIMTASIHM